MKFIQRIFYINVSTIPNDRIVEYVDEVKKNLGIKKPEEYGFKDITWEDLFIPTNGITQVDIKEVTLT